MKSNNLLFFSQLYHEHKKAVYHYVLKMTGLQMAAEDIVQNVFMRLFEKFGTIKQPDRIRYWLISAARNEVYDFFRKEKLRKEDSLEENQELQSEHSVESEFAELEMKQVVLREMELLPIDQKELFVLREYSGLSYEEIAQATGTSKELVKSRLFTIRQKLIRNIAKRIGVKI